MIYLRLTKPEFSTILAGLRALQEYGNRHGAPAFYGDMYDIATDGGSHMPLLPDEIDELVERINTAPDLPGCCHEHDEEDV